MSDVKAIVKKIDPYHKDVRAEWVKEFVDDLVRNEGKVVTLYDYEYYSDERETSYKLKSENGILWHQHGEGLGYGNWESYDSSEMTELVFHIYKTVELDEELFTI